MIFLNHLKLKFIISKLASRINNSNIENFEPSLNLTNKLQMIYKMNANRNILKFIEK